MPETPIDGTAERRSAAARLFDVRRVIGGLFTVYGVIVTLIGIFDSDAEIEKAQGVNINLWTGLAMRSEEHTSELQSQSNLVCRLLLEKKKARGRHTTRPH